MRGAVALLLFLFFALMVGVMCVPGANTSDESEEARASPVAGGARALPLTPTPTPTPYRAPGGARAAPPVAAGETSLPTTAEGEVTATTTAKSADERAAVTVPAGIKATIEGAPITKITIKPPVVLPATPPPNVEYKGYAYDFGPSGATFSEPVEILSLIHI